MNLELDFRSGIPIYLQVVDRIKEMIVNGRLKSGDQLPTVRALAQELRVNFNTVARAYRLLDENGIISTQQGRGTYILEMPPPEVDAAIRAHALEALAQRTLADVQRLGLTSRQLLESIMIQVQKQESENAPADKQEKKENKL